jgi:magnesium-transporting ATPase (P-type)
MTSDDVRMELRTETFGVTPRGLTAAQAAERLARDGPNRVPRPRPPSPWRQVAAQMTHFFAIMLWFAALLALVAGTPQLAIAIVVVVVLTGSSRSCRGIAPTALRRTAALLPFLQRVLGGPGAWDADPTIRRAIEIRDGVIQNPAILSFRTVHRSTRTGL